MFALPVLLMRVPLVLLLHKTWCLLALLKMPEVFIQCCAAAVVVPTCWITRLLTRTDAWLLLTKNTTINGGSLGSCIDEERSKVR